MIEFTAYIRPEPQGSAKAFVIGGKARITSDNGKLKPFRSEVTRCAMIAVRDAGMELPAAGKHVPVRVEIDAYFRRPDSLPKRHRMPARKPDADKVARSCLDSLTGVAFHDDGQVVELKIRKFYDSPERVEVRVSKVE